MVKGLSHEDKLGEEWRRIEILVKSYKNLKHILRDSSWFFIILVNSSLFLEGMNFFEHVQKFQYESRGRTLVLLHSSYSWKYLKWFLLILLLSYYVLPILESVLNDFYSSYSCLGSLREFLQHSCTSHPNPTHKFRLI